MFHWTPCQCHSTAKLTLINRFTSETPKSLNMLISSGNLSWFQVGMGKTLGRWTYNHSSLQNDNPSHLGNKLQGLKRKQAIYLNKFVQIVLPSEIKWQNILDMKLSTNIFPIYFQYMTLQTKGCTLQCKHYFPPICFGLFLFSGFAHGHTHFLILFYLQSSLLPSWAGVDGLYTPRYPKPIESHS